MINSNSSDDDVGAFCLLCLEELYNGNLDGFEKLIREARESGQLERIIAYKCAEGKTLSQSMTEYFDLFYSQYSGAVAHEAHYGSTGGITPYHSATHICNVLKLQKAVSASG